ncbi:uncharacterized protein LOC123708249 [Pieris brassicae]|uniref:uncharacterized protein LOC123708249 n=1 Tax=Pieris brassicae TaxID=7116 RepID=UPI001E661569|nr:uncharacterized protein LOC123708249 [Pieris brassicae]
MLISSLFFLCLLSLIYAYINHNPEFTATTSAIRQIWSGSCRLSCRQSQYSSFSGLSGLDGSNTISASPGTSHARATTICVCETCPCALIDNVLNTCRPVTDAYYGTLECLSNYTCNIMQIISGYTQYFTSVAGCGVSCPRQAQLSASRQLDSSQNINFGNQARVERKSMVKGIKSLILRRKSTSGNQTEDPERNEDIEPRKRTLSIVSKKESVDDTTSMPNGCARCIEKGYTCMKNCPRAKKN